MADIGGASGVGNAFASAQMRNTTATQNDNDGRGSIGSDAKSSGFRGFDKAPPPPPPKTVMQDRESALTTAKPTGLKEPPPLPMKPSDLGAAMRGTMPPHETGRPVSDHYHGEMVLEDDFNADIQENDRQSLLLKPFVPPRDSRGRELEIDDIGAYNADYINGQFGEGDIALAREKVEADKSTPEPREAWRSPIRFLADNIKWAAMTAFVLLGGRVR
ncbi:MAG: hypothetical protein AAF801_10790 [Pseudomonadota bacterium]